MKTLIKKFFVLCAVILSVSAVISLTLPEQTYADDCRYFLGMVSWDCNSGLTDGTSVDEESLTNGILVVGSNIFSDITVAAAYLVLGYVIYGGYQYTFSGGEPSKVISGKKALYQAFMGLAIVMSANIILTTIRVAFGVKFSADCVTAECASPDTIAINAVHWVVAVAGIISAIFIVYGGITYATSYGDPGKLKQGRNMITYALIGLAIVALAEIITAFVSNMIREANDTSLVNQTTIAKELNETTS